MIGVPKSGELRKPFTSIFHRFIKGECNIAWGQLLVSVCIKASLVAVIYPREILLQTGVWGWSGAKKSPQEFNHLLGVKQMQWDFLAFCILIFFLTMVYVDVLFYLILLYVR